MFKLNNNGIDSYIKY